MYCFYVSYKQKKIYLTDLPPDKVKKKFGFDLELVNSVKDKENIEIIKARVQKSHNGFTLHEEFQKPKYVMTPEHKLALLKSHLGKKRPEEVKRKISESKKGAVSNFKGKKHTYETRRIQAISKYGNQVNKDLIWIYNPDTFEERKVASRDEIPPGFSEGRDIESVEGGLYAMEESKRIRRITRLAPERLL